MSHSLVNACGLLAMMGVGWILSADRRRMNWRVIGWGVGLQLVFALFVFQAQVGTGLFRFLNDLIV
ncbi:hypothetical protein GF402_09945 [Candidatus Fermentibacteria bacterium]|nr:hypothetical protein [Candidatus Fermentibacteria bacterium]